MTQIIMAFLFSFMSHHPGPVTTNVHKGIYPSVQYSLCDTTDDGGDKGHIPPPPRR